MEEGTKFSLFLAGIFGLFLLYIQDDPLLCKISVISVAKTFYPVVLTEFVGELQMSQDKLEFASNEAVLQQIGELVCHPNVKGKTNEDELQTISLSQKFPSDIPAEYKSVLIIAQSSSQQHYCFLRRETAITIKNMGFTAIIIQNDSDNEYEDFRKFSEQELPPIPIVYVSKSAGTNKLISTINSVAMDLQNKDKKGYVQKQAMLTLRRLNLKKGLKDVQRIKEIAAVGLVKEG